MGTWDLDLFESWNYRPKFSPTWRKTLEVEVWKYKLIRPLYKKGHDNEWRLCVNKDEYINVLEHAHSGLLGGHFAGNTTVGAILC